MEIPLAIFYYIYLGLVVVFLFFSFVNIYHLLKYSRFSILSDIIVIFYLFITASIFLISWGFTSQINWQDTIQIISTFDQQISPGIAL